VRQQCRAQIQEHEQSISHICTHSIFKMLEKKERFDTFLF